MTNIDMLQEDAMFPWLADGSMADLDNNFEADLLDAMADRAYELEEAMRSSEQSEWSYVDRTNGIVSIDIMEQQVDQSQFQFIEPMEDFHDDQS